MPLRILGRGVAGLLMASAFGVGIAGVGAGSAAAATPYAYVTNSGSNTVSVINTSNNEITVNVAVGQNPDAIALTPNGQFAFASNTLNSSISGFAIGGSGTVTAAAINKPTRGRQQPWS